jgi:hypothetical protein
MAGASSFTGASEEPVYRENTDLPLPELTRELITRSGPQPEADQ